MRDSFDEPISFIEEIDPEPEPTGKWFHLREVLLGFLLLAGVLAWSGWEWWQQEYSQTNYRMAQAAADEQNWDQALHYFSTVKGFKDADTRAAEMNKLVTERDKQYEIASSSSEKGDWAATLQAAEVVKSIQRNYRDTSQLEAQASSEVYRSALQGVVALRTQARNPALYYRGISSWEWLPRSDRQSQMLRTLDASGAIVYDVPGENWDEVKLTPTATPEPASFRVSGSPGLKGRKLQVARYGSNDEAEYFGVNFDPSEHNFYWVGEKGMWAFRLDNRITNRSRPRVIMGFGGIEVTYQAFGSSKPVKVDVQPGWTSMDFAPDGEHVLLVDEGNPSSADEPLRLYLADAYGGNRRPLYTNPGSIQGVQFSPDSKHALLTTYFYNTTNNTEIYSAILIDLQSGTPHTLVESTLKYDQKRSNYPLPLSGAFLKEGPFAGYAIIAEDTGDQGHLSLFAPDRPASAVLEMQIQAAPSGSIWADHKDGSTLLVWQARSGSFGSGSPLISLEIKPDMSTVESALPVEGKGFLAFGGIRDKWLVYGGREYGGGGNKPNLYGIFAVPLSDMREQREMPGPIYHAGLPDVSSFAFARAIYPGPTMLSYVEGGELHMRTYDNSVDLTLESGVQHLYDPSTTLRGYSLDNILLLNKKVL